MVTSYIRISESKVKSAKRRGALDVLVVIIGATMALDTARNAELYLPVTGGRYFLRFGDCSDQTECHDFEVREARGTRFLCWVLGLK